MSAASVRLSKTDWTPVRFFPEYSSWGRYPHAHHRRIHHVNWADQLPEVLRGAEAGSLLPYGLGRSYGDSCLNDGRDLIACARLNRILGFDCETGLLICEGGVSLSEILEVCVPKGWFPAVTPGTRFVTVGGAIANDVHGKNHHRAGTFGCHVRRLGLLRSDYGLIECSPEVNGNWFRATVGGLGLTGVIAWAEIQLRPIQGPMIDTVTLCFRSLDEFLDLSNESDAKSEYTVAWIDCFSGSATRGVFFCGNHSAEPGQSKPRIGPKVPFPLPAWLLNRWSMKSLNSAYYAWHCFKRGSAVAPYDRFFYPLDSVRQWNLVYGKRGFLQYQCVVPETCLPAFKEVLDLIRRAGMGSFLGVIKRFGAVEPPGILSFPRSGLTLALDFPMRSRRTLRLLSELDRVVQNSGGALYPGKDARMSAAMFQASFPQWRVFQSYIDTQLSSSFWRRVTSES